MHTHNSCGARKHLESCPEHDFTPISRRMWGDELPSSCLRPACATVQLTHVNTASSPRRWTPGGRRRRHVRGVSGNVPSDERGCSAGVWTEASESVRPGCGQRRVRVFGRGATVRTPRARVIACASGTLLDWTVSFHVPCRASESLGSVVVARFLQRAFEREHGCQFGVYRRWVQGATGIRRAWVAVVGPSGARYYRKQNS
jgi:hypothetical protein